MSFQSPRLVLKVNNFQLFILVFLITNLQILLSLATILSTLDFGTVEAEQQE
jgi:hypothetical protein